jgi:putative oxidoreductase
MSDLAVLILRATVGGLLAGHGAQKLFGAFGGPGPRGTAGWLESVGLRPGERWAPVAAVTEFGGGVLTALGFLGPLGPIAILAAMSMATITAHRGKPIWATEGGAELPVTNTAAALAIALNGPGRYSLDTALRLQVPAGVVAAVVLGAAGGVAAGAGSPPLPADENASSRLA